jgi:hypothetical protein
MKRVDDGGKIKHTGHMGILWGGIDLLESKENPVVFCAGVEVLTVMVMESFDFWRYSLE